MSKLKIPTEVRHWQSIAYSTIIFLLVILTLMVSLNYEATAFSAKEILTAEDVLLTMKAQRVPFNAENSLKPGEYKIGDAVPDIYKDSRGNLLFIYTYHSFVECRANRSRPDIIKILSQKPGGNIFCRLYTAKNLLLAYVAAANDEESYQLYCMDMKRIEQIIFTELNDGHQLTFAGQGKNWDAKITQRYYEHWWTDENNKTYYDSWHMTQPELRFKGKTRKAGLLTVSFTSSSSLSRNMMEISATELDQVIKLGSSGGNGARSRENDVYTVVVDFNGQEETFELRAEGR